MWGQTLLYLNNANCSAFCYLPSAEGYAAAFGYKTATMSPVCWSVTGDVNFKAAMPAVWQSVF